MAESFGSPAGASNCYMFLAIAGFVLNGSGRVAPAQFVAWLPVVGALAALVLPAPY